MIYKLNQVTVIWRNNPIFLLKTWRLSQCVTCKSIIRVRKGGAGFLASVPPIMYFCVDPPKLYL